MPNLKELSLDSDGKFATTGARVAIGSKVVRCGRSTLIQLAHGPANTESQFRAAQGQAQMGARKRKQRQLGGSYPQMESYLRPSNQGAVLLLPSDPLNAYHELTTNVLWTLAP